jgi:mono/diheme cytochrome c family protein
MRLSFRATAAAVLALASLPVAAQGRRRETMEIPEAAKAVRNPVPAGEDSLRAGRGLWRAHCETCHGTAGRGDGPNARLHEMRKAVRPQDLTSTAVQDGLTDGELFWRITNGIVDGDNVIMPAYGDKVQAEKQRWQLVHYVRYLGGRK